MNTDVNAPVIIVDEIEVIKNDFDRTEGTTDSFTVKLRLPSCNCNTCLVIVSFLLSRVWAFSSFLWSRLKWALRRAKFVGFWPILCSVYGLSVIMFEVALNYALLGPLQP
ncbi:hypothetical protein T03_5817 [Trichinella britovi]|uniref:Uncharacterized protein n=1 Tax=Trichinella britovi TaxID=45882 RepID=A0A0V1CJB4_TRIBR|nr:hypothetical protein T03_5817 [Trichinella britovi]